MQPSRTRPRMLAPCAHHEHGTLSGTEQARAVELHNTLKTRSLVLRNLVDFGSTVWYNVCDRSRFFALLRVLSAGGRRPWFRVAATQDRPELRLQPRALVSPARPFDSLPPPHWSWLAAAIPLFSACTGPGRPARRVHGSSTTLFLLHPCLTRRSPSPRRQETKGTSHDLPA